MLVAAMNPCPCGYFSDPNHECTCTYTKIEDSLQRVVLGSLGFVDVLYQVPQFREDEFFAGKFARLVAAWYAKDQGLTDDASRGPGKERSRVDFFIAQLAKKGTKGSQLFGKHGSDCLYGYISRTDPGASSHQDCMRVMFLNYRADRI